MTHAKTFPLNQFFLMIRNDKECKILGKNSWFGAKSICGVYMKSDTPSILTHYFMNFILRRFLR